MTTGRINQISWSRPPGPAPFRINNGRRRVPGGPEPPKGPGCNSVITWKGRTSARPPRQPPAHRGDARTWPSNCPHCSPSDTGPHAGCSTSPPLRALRGLRHTGLGWGVRPRGHADERRLPRGGSPRESGYQDWPAANDPQTPSVPGTKRPPGFGHPSGPTPRPGTLKPGERRHRCGGRPPPFLRRGSRECGSPQRHQPQRGGLPGREGCVGAPAAAFPRGGVLAFAFITPTHTLRHRLGARASRTYCRAPSRCPGGHPTMGVGHQGRIPRTRWATHISPLGVPRVVRVLRPRAGGQRAWARGPVAQGQLASNPPRRHGRPSPPRQCRHGQGGVRGSCPWATTRHRAHHAAWPTCAVSGYTMRLHACALRPSPFAPSPLPGPSSPLSPPGLGQKPFGPRAPQPGCRAGPAARGLAPTGGSRRQGPLQGPLLPWPPASRPRSHRPSSPANWPVASHHPGRGAPARLPQAPPSPGPGPGSRRRRPTPYTLHPTDGATTSRAQPPNSNSTHNSRVESSPAPESNATRVTHSVPRAPAPWPGSAGLPQTPRLPSATAAACQHPRVRPQAPGAGPPRAAPGATTARQLANPGPRWRTPCGLPDGHARLPTGREPLGRQPAPRQLTGDDVFPHQRLPTGQRVRTCRATRREATAVSRSPASPLQAPGAAGGDDGEVCLHKSSQGSG